MYHRERDWKRKIEDRENEFVEQDDTCTEGNPKRDVQSVGQCLSDGA